MRAQRLDVAGREEQAGHAVLDQVGHAADLAGDRRAVHPRALGQRIREALGHRGQQIDVQRVIKAVDVLLPAEEAVAVPVAKRPGQRADLVGLLAVARDQQPHLRALRVCLGKGAHERGHVLDGVDARGDAADQAVRLDAEPGKILLPRLPRLCAGKATPL